MISHMGSDREHITIRLGLTGIAKLRELAEQETEGNVSQMTRKLLREAIEARVTEGSNSVVGRVALQAQHGWQAKADRLTHPPQ